MSENKTQVSSGDTGQNTDPKPAIDLTMSAEDDGPVVTVGVVNLDIRDIETIEREFGNSRLHTRETGFDLFSTTPHGGQAGSSISSQSQPGGSVLSPDSPGLRPDTSR